MRLIFDSRLLQLYPVGRPGFKGGTEQMVGRIAHGLAERGHTVHVVTPDLEQEEQRGPTEWWWGPHCFPRNADAVVLLQGLQGLDADYESDKLVMACTTIDPSLGPNNEWAAGVDAFPVLSQYHLNLLCQTTPTVQRGRCYITGLGVDLPHEQHTREWRIPGRMLWSSEPARGLWHMLDIFDHVRKAMPEATLHVGYNFARQFEYHRWVPNSISEAMWACKERMEMGLGVVNLGDVSRELVLRREQAECQVFAYPCDPPTPGSELFCLSAMEAAAAGAALVLADNEALPEVYEDTATVLPLPGKWLPSEERRYDSQDWGEAVVGLMSDPVIWQEYSNRSRRLAAANSWDAVLNRWEAMFTDLAHG